MAGFLRCRLHQTSVSRDSRKPPAWCHVWRRIDLFLGRQGHILLMMRDFGLTCVSCKIRVKHTRTQLIWFICNIWIDKEIRLSMYACGCPFTRRLLCHSNARRFHSSMFQVSLRGQPTRPQGNVASCSGPLVGNHDKNVPGWRLWKGYTTKPLLFNQVDVAKKIKVGEFSKSLHQYFHQGQVVKCSEHARKPTHAVFIHSHTGGVIGIPKCSNSIAYHSAFVSSWIFTPSMCLCMYMCMCMCLCLCVLVFVCLCKCMFVYCMCIGIGILTSTRICITV